MKKIDLTSGAAKLDQAVHSLQAAYLDVSESWDDQTSRKFADTYLAHAEPPVRMLIDSIRRLAETLSNAQRQCDDE
jgi:hypothetical protein